eukprot:CAMPEP_0114672914 /NCGR_PEP_ID=MMETSP0191-20121206/43748_1 /TAXON_ID=126664 /ORGANISM="Sorites sp." /LENGTH=341 /DNA_ID=CAMNT_0001936461 /DNA_START=903 /DNA_END=1928 /DNA_ORIENTATION=-
MATAHAKMRLSKNIDDIDVENAMKVLDFALTNDADPDINESTFSLRESNNNDSNDDDDDEPNDALFDPTIRHLKSNPHFDEKKDTENKQTDWWENNSTSFVKGKQKVTSTDILQPMSKDSNININNNDDFNTNSNDITYIRSRSDNIHKMKDSDNGFDSDEKSEEQNNDKKDRINDFDTRSYDNIHEESFEESSNDDNNDDDQTGFTEQFQFNPDFQSNTYENDMNNNDHWDGIDNQAIISDNFQDNPKLDDYKPSSSLSCIIVIFKILLIPFLWMIFLTFILSLKTTYDKCSNDMSYSNITMDFIDEFKDNFESIILKVTLYYDDGIPRLTDNAYIKVVE